MTNGTFMPYVLVANRPAIEVRIARLAAYCGLTPSFDAFLEAILALREKLGVPHSLVDLKVPNDRRDEIGDMAVADPSRDRQQSGDARQGAGSKIFDRAYEGRV